MNCACLSSYSASIKSISLHTKELGTSLYEAYEVFWSGVTHWISVSLLVCMVATLRVDFINMMTDTSGDFLKARGRRSVTGTNWSVEL